VDDRLSVFETPGVARNFAVVLLFDKLLFPNAWAGLYLTLAIPNHT
jgi:hypothetical protein